MVRMVPMRRFGPESSPPTRRCGFITPIDVGLIAIEADDGGVELMTISADWSLVMQIEEIQKRGGYHSLSW